MFIPLPILLAMFVALICLPFFGSLVPKRPSNRRPSEGRLRKRQSRRIKALQRQCTRALRRKKVYLALEFANKVNQFDPVAAQPYFQQINALLGKAQFDVRPEPWSWR
jgi:hypothetical protein